MSMTRRFFLKGVGLTIAAIAAAPLIPETAKASTIRRIKQATDYEEYWSSWHVYEMAREQGRKRRKAEFKRWNR